MVVRSRSLTKATRGRGATAERAAVRTAVSARRSARDESEHGRNKLDSCRAREVAFQSPRSWATGRRSRFRRVNMSNVAGYANAGHRSALTAKESKEKEQSYA